MAIKSISDAKALKMYGAALGRERIALKIISICKAVAEQKDYKVAINAAGRIRALTECCKFDLYWEEKMLAGFSAELYEANIELAKFNDQDFLLSDT